MHPSNNRNCIRVIEQILPAKAGSLYARVNRSKLRTVGQSAAPYSRLRYVKSCWHEISYVSIHKSASTYVRATNNVMITCFKHGKIILLHCISSASAWNGNNINLILFLNTEKLKMEYEILTNTGSFLIFILLSTYNT